MLDDWRRDARVDGTYPVACYLPAIRHLPADLRDYSAAAADIEAAFHARVVARSQASPRVAAPPRRRQGGNGFLFVLTLTGSLALVSSLAIALSRR